MSKDDEIRSSDRRRRNILYLIEKFLRDNGFLDSSNCIKNEARLQDDYEICDNIDLESMYLEYASFYQVKFGKYPKILKKNTTNLKVQVNNVVKKPAPTLSSNQKKEDLPKTQSSINDSLQIKQINTSNNEINATPMDYGIKFENFSFDDESVLNGCKDLEQQIKSTIITKNLGYHWDDVCGNSKALAIIKEAVIMPLEHPELFSNELKPWKSLLLHGPPGGGKTLLAKILSSETYGKVTFFNVTSSCVTSKWRGESEKIIKVLFHYAKVRAPAIIFLDEVDALMSSRERSSEHEASKRFKNEFLQLLDGIEDNSSSIFVLASTNIPWDIDPAFLRRFEKKILIGLPNAQDRMAMVQRFYQDAKTFPPEILKQITESCIGFTGDQIRLACKEAAMNRIRNFTMNGSKSKQVTPGDVIDAFKTMKPIDVKLVNKYTVWNCTNGI